jgi:hypothetical protein
MGTHRELAMRARIVEQLFGETVDVRIGRYRVLGEIGKGGLGVVHEAHDPDLDRRVALKLIRPDAATRVGVEEMHLRLRREAQAMARLNHPNVVSVFDVGRDGESVFIAMELVDGLTLHRWCETRTWRERLDVLLQAGRGIAAAHAHGIIHRDFKPGNVLVDHAGVAHVLDFGLARAVGEATADTLTTRDDVSLGDELTRTGALMGTPKYMAPEQFEGLPLDPRTDQWAFCVTAHEVLFGARPFEGDSIDALRRAVLVGRVDTATASGVPAAVRRAIARGLAVRPSDRHASMSALLRALEDGARSRRAWWGAGVGAVALVAVSATTTAAVVRGEAPIVAPSPDIVVSELSAEWTTPHQIRWHWTAEGEPDRLLHYELVTGPTREAVLARGPDTQRWTAAVNPELGRFLLPKTTGVDPVRGTTTDQHAPRMQVFAQVIATDTSGVESVSNVASARTQEPATHEIVVLSEDVLRGYSIPGGFDPSGAAPYRGGLHYRYDVDCPDGDPECWYVLRRQGLGVEIDGDLLTRGNYETTAYLEVAVKITGATPPWWSEFWIWYTDDDHDESDADLSRIAVYTGWTLRADGQYHVWEVPLRAFHRWQGQSIPYDEIVAYPLYQFAVSGSWTNGSQIDVDEIRIRW